MIKLIDRALKIALYSKGKLLKLPKYIEVSVSTNFKSTEFNCKCQGLCDITEISPKLISIIQQLRDELGEPIHIAEGYTCFSYDDSFHFGGIAAKLVCSNLERLADIFEAKFSQYSLGLYDDYIYIDLLHEEDSVGDRWDKRTNKGDLND